MKFNPDIHHRSSIRLKGYDYFGEGAYFVTVCAEGHGCLFGEVVERVIILNHAGRMVEEVWNQLPMHYRGIMVDSHVVMPNHFHGIIFLVGAAPCGRPDFSAPCGRPDFSAPCGRPGAGCSEGSKFPRGTEGHQQGGRHPQGGGHPQGGAPTAMSLFDVMHRFKSYSTARYRHAVTECGWPPFPGRLWQRGYYERIIRDEKELDAARKYILENPMKWAMDKENPENAPGK